MSTTASGILLTAHVMITMNPQVFMWIIGILVGAIVALIGFIVNYILKSQASAKKDTETMIYNLKAEFYAYKKELSDSVALISKEQDEIKFNYLKRFESVNHNITNTKEEIVGKIHDLHTILVKLNTKDNG